MITYKDVGLFKHEYEALKDHLQREPSETELYLASVMWSEHCSYKSTRPLLKKFPKTGKYVLKGEGENAGVVNLGKGYGLAFKVESHNHPSAVEPYQGAATGVGGIIRDILAMGARPVAVMDGLFFGEPNHPETLRIKPGVVRGVGGYGNCVGVPNIGGKTIYHACYNHNPLVNAFCAGVVKLDDLVSAQTAKAGHKIMVLGAATGRDGIAGAAFASMELDQNNRDDRPRVQVGDAFAEKQLIECFIELNEKKLIKAAQDMGAAGVISSTSEVAAVSHMGMKIHLDEVHQREDNMTGWEIALSESQERFLLIVDEADIKAIQDIAKKWELNTSVIGQCASDGKFELYHKGELVADIAPDIIGGNAPVIPWPAIAPADYKERSQREALQNKAHSFADILLNLLQSPSLKDHSPIYRQYDSQVQTNSLRIQPNQVAEIRITEADISVGFVMEANPLKCHIAPKEGAADLVATTTRALAIAGFEAMALSDGINHASPEKPEQFWELSQNIDGMVEACSHLDCPVISGNVSLYNESPSSRILPSPVIVTLGIKPLHIPSLSETHFAQGDSIYLVGSIEGSLGASQYLALYTKNAYGPLSLPDWAQEKAFIKAAQLIVKEQKAHFGRLIMGGGLAVSLAKLCLSQNQGLHMALPKGNRENILFGEAGLRCLYGVSQAQRKLFEEIWKNAGLSCIKIGEATGNELVIDDDIQLKLEQLHTAHKGA